MKRNTALLGLMVFLLAVSAGAQTATTTPGGQLPGQRGGGTSDVLSLLPLLAQQRGGGPGQRGTAPAVAQEGRVVRSVVLPQTAWWADTRLVGQLGLSDDQKRRIETTFEAHRQNLVSTAEQLEREEAQLSRLLEADTIDRNGASTQINRVIQARGEVERTNSAMTLEMREHLTRAQWMQLQASQANGLRAVRIVQDPVLGQTAVATPFGPAVVAGQRGGAPVAATTPATAEPLSRIGGDVAQKNLISQVQAMYPPLARAARIRGVVLLQTTITKEGAVGDLKVISGHPLLNDAAMDAVRQWRYRPMLLNGQPVAVVTTVSVNFDFQ